MSHSFAFWRRPELTVRDDIKPTSGGGSTSRPSFSLLAKLKPRNSQKTKKRPESDPALGLSLTGQTSSPRATRPPVDTTASAAAASTSGAQKRFSLLGFTSRQSTTRRLSRLFSAEHNRQPSPSRLSPPLIRPTEPIPTPRDSIRGEYDVGNESVGAEGEEEPAPEERQKSEILVTAWLEKGKADLSLSSSSSSSVQIADNATTTPNENNILPFVVEPLIRPVRHRMRSLDSISEDEVPDLTHSSSIPSTPSTPVFALGSLVPSGTALRTTSERSRSPARRLRDDIIKEEPMPLDAIPRRSTSSVTTLPTIQDESEEDIPHLQRGRLSPITTASSSPSSFGNNPSRRRSMFNALSLSNKNPGSSSPIEPTSSPSITRASVRDDKRRSSFPATFVNDSNAKASRRASLLPSFGRERNNNNNNTRFDTVPAAARRPLQPLSHSQSLPQPPTFHTSGSIALLTQSIKEEESRRLTEVAYL